MAYAEDLVKLRNRIIDAVKVGVLDVGSKDTIEAILIQIMNDAEKNRQNCVTQADNLRRQAATIDGQAAAFSSVVSIVYNVINGYIKVAERNLEDEARAEAEKREKEDAQTELKDPEELDKKKVKKVNK